MKNLKNHEVNGNKTSKRQNVQKNKLHKITIFLFVENNKI